MAIVADDSARGRILHLTRAGARGIELHLRDCGINSGGRRNDARALLLSRGLGLRLIRLGRRKRQHRKCQHYAERDEQALRLHRAPPQCSSFPRTTPEATVIVAFGAAGRSARATPRFTRASTVLRPRESVWMKVTIVPSGTGLPLQSRTGSVSTTMPSFVGWARKRRLHGSDATCCTTLLTGTAPPSDAVNWASPAFADEGSFTL